MMLILLLLLFHLINDYIDNCQKSFRRYPEIFFFFLRLKSLKSISSKRGGAGRSGAESGAYRRHVRKSLDKNNFCCRIGVSTTFFFLPTLHYYITYSRSTHCILSMTSHT